jgi:sec-independent protein translocase protein TatA
MEQPFFIYFFEIINIPIRIFVRFKKTAMTNYILFISGGEIVLVMLLALLFFGSKAIPDIAKTMGKGLREFKKATNEIQREINDYSSDIKKDINEVSSTINRETNEITKGMGDVTSSVSRETNEITKGINDAASSATTETTEIKNDGADKYQD